MLSRKENCQLFFLLFDFQHYFVSSAEGGVDAVIEPKEGLFAVLHAAWNDGGAEEDSSVFAAIDAVTKGKTDIRGFL